MRFEGFNEVLLRHKYFWTTLFWQLSDDRFKIFRTFHGNTFCSSFIFRNETNNANSLLMIHSKCTVMHYTSSLNKHYLRTVKYAILLFSISYSCYFIFRQMLYEKTFIFNTNFQNPFQDVVFYRILGPQTLWYLNGDPLNTRQNLKKCLFYLGLK